MICMLAMTVLNNKCNHHLVKRRKKECSTCSDERTFNGNCCSASLGHLKYRTCLLPVIINIASLTTLNMSSYSYFVCTKYSVKLIGDFLV
jgi:hypothetical protein